MSTLISAPSQLRRRILRPEKKSEPKLANRDRRPRHGSFLPLPESSTRSFLGQGCMNIREERLVEKSVPAMFGREKKTISPKATRGLSLWESSASEFDKLPLRRPAAVRAPAGRLKIARRFQRRETGKCQRVPEGTPETLSHTR